MRSKFRLFAAYLMLVLLPLQAIAAVAGYSCAGAMASGHVMMAQMSEDCAQRMHAKTVQHASAQTDDGQTPHADHSQKPAPCGMSAYCAAIGALAVLPSFHHFPLDTGALKLSAIVSSDYTSFIPEG